MENDMISVVISVLNGGDTLDACLKSVIEQDYKPVEIIVIDGGSVDDTLNVIKKYANYIDYSISEPDTGIYNAWNKGVRVISGSWVCFIGSDDKFATKDSLGQLAAIAIYPAINYASGRVALTNSNGEQHRVVGKPLVSRELGWGMKFAHPGSLHHVSLFQRYGLFNEYYKIAGDYEFILRCSDTIRTAFTSSTIVLMGDGGVSHTMQYRVFLESYKALRDAPGFGAFVATRLLFISILKSAARNFISSSLITLARNRFK